VDIQPISGLTPNAAASGGATPGSSIPQLAEQHDGLADAQTPPAGGYTSSAQPAAGGASIAGSISILA